MVSNEVSLLRLLIPIHVLTHAGDSDKLQYLLPNELTRDPHELWETKNIVQLVYTEPGKDTPEGCQYVVHKEDEMVSFGGRVGV